MDVIIVCHTEFGFVKDKLVVPDKSATQGVSVGVLNLINLADKYGAKISFAVCPEVTDFFPKNIIHEIGLHVHPGLQGQVGDKFLRENCKQTGDSTVLVDYQYQEQFDMIKAGKEYIRQKLSKDPKIFVAGRWSENNDTIKALIENGFTHDCSAPAHSISDHYDWQKLPRICMPYNPDKYDYQKNGDLPLLIVPISQTLFGGTINPEGVVTFGYKWLESCFKEYYKLQVPLFHICLHSPSMTDKFYFDIFEKFIKFVASHKNVNFKFASQIKKYPSQKFGTDISSYISGINGQLIKTALGRLF